MKEKAVRRMERREASNSEDENEDDDVSKQTVRMIRKRKHRKRWPSINPCDELRQVTSWLDRSTADNAESSAEAWAAGNRAAES